MHKILFITTTNLSTNPRLLKELKLADKIGFEITFAGFKLGNWSDKTEKKYLDELNEIRASYIRATRQKLFPWLISTVIWKISIFFSRIFPNSVWLNAYSENKRCRLLKRQVLKLRDNYDLVVSHNLGSLYPAYNIAKKHKIPFIFDIEDYHPGEKCSAVEKQRREFLMKKLLPKATSITYASSLIGEHSFALLEKESIPDNLLVNNCFSQGEFGLKQNNSRKIQFVWFSQNIAGGRGLELIIPALSKFRNEIHLTLIGNLYPDFKNNFLNSYEDFTTILPPLPQKELHQKLCEFDIGLAIELSSADFNRDICLTNKIFAYAQSGLYILATDTSGQKQFMNEHQLLGLVSGQTEAEMEDAIGKILKNIQEIRSKKKERFEYAKNLSWENESPKLKQLWNKVLNLAKI